MTTSRSEGKLRRLMVIDNQPDAVAWVQGACDPAIEVRETASLTRGIEAVASFRPDLVVIASSMFSFDATRVDLGRQCIEESIAELRCLDRVLPILIRCTGDVVSSQVAIAAGGLECVGFVSIASGEEHLLGKIAAISDQRQSQRQPRVQLSQMHDNPESELPLIGRCAAILEVLEMIGAMSRVCRPVLITGEVGTGKRTVAWCIHKASDGNRDGYRVIDAAASDAHEIESCLFPKNDLGEIKFNNNLVGTIVIAHAEHLTERLQAMFACAFRSSSVKPRMIMTSVKPTTLWPDLGYQLLGNAIALPPLRERGNDIGVLIDHFVAEILGAAIDSSTANRCVSADALDLLHQYSWPGNLMELRSVIVGVLGRGHRLITATDTLRAKLGHITAVPRAVDAQYRSAAPGDPQYEALSQRHANRESTMMNEETKVSIDNGHRLIRELRSESFWRSETAGYASSLPPAPEMGMLLGEATEAVETGLIAAVLSYTQGNIAQSARLLGITRVSLRRKIQSLRLTVPGRTAVPAPVTSPRILS